ncbi:hypothetical protein PFISCL1PPCAC_11175, partial [Pristionchus fissidentatus]
SSGSSMQSRRSESKKEKRKSKKEDEKIFRFSHGACPTTKEYIGLRSAEEAEDIVTRPTEFKLYHRLGQNRSITSLEARLPLYIAYRSTKNVARHIPLKTIQQGTRHFLVVGDGDSDHIFETVEALIKFYKTYVQLNSSGDSGMVDVFPV